MVLNRQAKSVDEQVKAKVKEIQYHVCHSMRRVAQKKTLGTQTAPGSHGSVSGCGNWAFMKSTKLRTLADNRRRLGYTITTDSRKPALIAVGPYSISLSATLAVDFHFAYPTDALASRVSQCHSAWPDARYFCSNGVIGAAVEYGSHVVT